MPPAIKNPFAENGWISTPLPTIEASSHDPVIMHPDQETISLYSNGGASTLLSHLKLFSLLPEKASWMTLFADFNTKMAPHDQRSSIDQNESLTGFKTWHRRLQVWSSLKPSVTILTEELHDAWFCSYRGAICFLHYLAFNSSAAAPVSLSKALSEVAKKILMQSWQGEEGDAKVSCHPLKRLFVSPTSKSDKFQKSYKECVDILKPLGWWPQAWNHLGPDVRVTQTSEDSTVKTPLPLCRKYEAGLRDEVVQHLNKHVLGQPDAVRRSVDAVIDKLNGAADASKPAVVVFAGESGHGKTFLGKHLVEALFPGLLPEQLDTVYLYFSVSHMSDKSSLSSLIGASQGLNQSEHPGRLVTFLQHQQKALSPAHAERKIHWIVFLDEVDRAYPTLLEDLRQWFDQGVVISGFGETLHARNGIIILGSNAGTGITVRMPDGRDRQSTINVLSRPPPSSPAERDCVMVQVKRAVLEDLCHGQPATYGRLTYIVPFFQFSPEEFKQLLTTWLHSEVCGRIKNFQGVPVPANLEIRFSGDVIDWLHSTYDEKAGLRGLSYRVNRVTGELTKLFESASCRDVARDAAAFSLETSMGEDNCLRFSHQQQMINYEHKSAMSQTRRSSNINLLQRHKAATGTIKAAAKKRSQPPTATATALRDSSTSSAAVSFQPTNGLKSSHAIVDAINKLGASFCGSREEFQAAVAGELSGRAGSVIADSTFKKAFRLSCYTSQGKGKQWALVPTHRTPMTAQSTVCTVKDAEMTSADDNEADNEDVEDQLEGVPHPRKRQRTDAAAP